MLIKDANLNKFEIVEIYYLNTGERVATYIIGGVEREISLKGTAARLVQKGDLIIIACYAQISEEEIQSFIPKIMFVNELNEITNKNAN